MNRLNSENIEQNIDAMLARSGKSLTNATLLGISPSVSHSAMTRAHNDVAANVFQVLEFDQGSSDSLCVGLNGITTEQQRNLISFDVIHYFATSTLAANDAGDVL